MAISKIKSNSIADDAITSDKVADGVISAADVADGTLTNAKLADGTVENAKLANSSVTINGNSVSLGASIAAGMFRNIIINGDMSIAQRGTSKTGLTNGDNGYWTCDRYQFRELGSTTAVFTQTQSTDVPSGQGFVNSLKMDVTTAETPLASDVAILIRHKIEGKNLQYLKKGTTNAESLTASFWVKSSKTGTYILEIFDNDNSRTINKSYTIDTANTWEKKTITFAGDTTGVLDNDNGASIQVSFYLSAGTNYTSGTLATSWESYTAANTAVGQVNLADSTANDWYITGIQLEAGTTASDFEFLPVDMNLARCQRYYNILAKRNGSTHFANAFYYNSSDIRTALVFNPDMRATPTIAVGSGTNYYSFFRDGTADTFDGFTATSNLYGTILIGTGTMSGTAGQAGNLRMNEDDAFIAFDAEL